MQIQSIRLSEIDGQFLVHLPRDNNWAQIPLHDCIALLNPAAIPQPRARGMLVLADGQRLPGEAATSAKSHGETLAWMHPWLGRLEIELDSIASIVFTPKSVPPPPGQGDVVLLANGDRQEGLIVALGDPITMEPAGTGETIEIPLELVTAVTMVSAPKPPQGRRIWFVDGTVIDVVSITVGADGYLRLAGAALANATENLNGPSSGSAAATTPRISLSQIAAILLDPNALIPLSSLTPARVEGPATRFVHPRPVALHPNAALNLSDIEMQGPLVIRYGLPAGVQRFIAEAELPRQSRQWGDLELVVRSNDQEVFRTRLSSATPVASINIPTPGRELTFELLQGANGPIQDQVILRRPMLLKGR